MHAGMWRGNYYYLKYYRSILRAKAVINLHRFGNLQKAERIFQNKRVGHC